MSSTIASGLEKVKESVQASGQDAKAADLARDTKVADDKSRFTTDHGCPVSNTDDWLTVSTDDKIGYVALAPSRTSKRKR